jgi:non-ribosomal peptide synthetase component F
VLRQNVADAATFRELLRRVRETCLDAYAHQVPPEKLVEALAAQRGGATSALYEVWFQLEAASHEHLQLPGMTVERYEVAHADLTFELSLVLSETPHGITGAFEYDSDVFDAELIQQLAVHFAALLRQITTEPTIAVTAISFADAAPTDCDFSAALEA